jgi:hypothetical protein
MLKCFGRCAQLVLQRGCQPRQTLGFARRALGLGAVERGQTHFLGLQIHRLMGAARLEQIGFLVEQDCEALGQAHQRFGAFGRGLGGELGCHDPAS